MHIYAWQDPEFLHSDVSKVTVETSKVKGLLWSTFELKGFFKFSLWNFSLVKEILWHSGKPLELQRWINHQQFWKSMNWFESFIYEKKVLNKVFLLYLNILIFCYFIVLRSPRKITDNKNKISRPRVIFCSHKIIKLWPRVVKK